MGPSSKLLMSNLQLQSSDMDTMKILYFGNFINLDFTKLSVTSVVDCKTTSLDYIMVVLDNLWKM